MKRKIMIGVLAGFLIVLGGVVILWLYASNRGFSAHEEPTWIEKVLAKNARNIATPSEAKNLKNPEADTEENKAEAREHFVEHCAVCHGVDGRGDTTFGRNMYPKVPDLADSESQELTDGELFYIISNGVRLTGMPAFGKEDSPESIWHLVSFIRRVPQLSREELIEMQRLAGQEMAGESEERHEQKPEGKAGEDKAKPTPRPKAKPHPHGPGTKPHDDR